MYVETTRLSALRRTSAGFDLRPHVKIHRSVSRHRKTAAIWADVRKRGMLVELWRLAGEAYASRTSNEFVLTSADILGITGDRNVTRALRTFDQLMTELSYPCNELVRSQRRVSVRNFSEKQYGRPSSGVPSELKAEAETEEEKIAPATQAFSSSDGSSKASERKASVGKIWPECQKAALEVGGPRWDSLSTARVRFMAARLQERPKASPEILVHAIRGAVSYWQSTIPEKLQEMLAGLKPERVYIPKNFEKYLEHYDGNTGGRPTQEAIAAKLRQLNA